MPGRIFRDALGGINLQWMFIHREFNTVQEAITYMTKDLGQSRFEVNV